MRMPPMGSDPPPLCSPLHNRSKAITRGAALVVPALESGWFMPDGAARQVVIVVTLAAIAIVALLVAGIAYLNDQRRASRRRGDADQLFTTTPLPMPREEMARQARGSEHHAFTSLRIPRWVQAGSLLVALAIT